MKQTFKYLFLFGLGGLLYNVIEIMYRGWSHWTMFLLGGGCFVLLGLINESIPWEMSLWKQMIFGAIVITSMEFVTGCIVNLWLGWSVWDYSDMAGSLLGQICPQFFFLWMLIALLAIIMDDWLRYWIFGEEFPHYKWK